MEVENKNLRLSEVEIEPDDGTPAIAGAEHVIEEPAPPAPPKASPVKEDPPATPEAKEEPNPVEDVEPSDEPVQRLVMDSNGNTAEYWQSPLLFFQKIEFFSLVGDTLSKAMEGEGGLTVMSLMNTAPRTLDSDSLQSADTFIAGIAKLTSHVPDFLKDCYCIWLDVPKRERAWAREAMNNLNDSEGISIIETFLDQNAAAIEDFFRNEGARLLEKFQSSFDRSDS